MQPIHDRVEELNRKVQQTVAPLGDLSADYALLDFPDYSNVGDSLIWLGELAFFDRTATRRPAYVSTIKDLDVAALVRAVPNGPIYLSGGGNFGDLWPRFQAFRLKLLRELRGRPLIQLPQTIHFRDPENVALTRQAIAAHGNFTMLVRDRASLAFARQELGCEAQLCPDMAFCMGNVARPASPTRELLFLLRTDQEQSAGRGLPDLPAGSVLEDWIHGAPQANRWERALARVTRSAALLAGGAPDEARFRARAQSELERGRTLLGSARAVVTDRLHGHILSVLMGVPHAVLDNSYGKVGGFFEVWTDGLPGIALCTSLAEAADHALASIRQPA